MHMSVEDALAIVKEKNEKRYNHILGVYEKATELAVYYQEDRYKCQIAAIFHDYAKNESIAFMEEIIEKHLNVDYLQHSTNIYHAPVARYLMTERFNITDPVILNAVEYHVTGHPNMDNVAKIVYISDYTEKNRTHPSVDFCRYLSGISLDLAVTGISDHTLKFLKELKQTNIHPLSIATYEKFLDKVGVSYYESIKDNYKRL